MPALKDQEQLNWLQLIRTPSIGPITFHRLIARYGTAARALAALPEMSRKAGRKAPLKAASRQEAEQELAAADRHGARLIAACEDDYPKPLAAIPDAPPIIYVRGEPTLFEKTAIAIVGARNASAVGRKMARSLAADLGAHGIVIVSGLARGIDGAVHETSLGTGTIAVVAGGVDIIYPPEHAGLTQDIAKQGIVMSECPIGYRPTGRDFPKRNRLISGLSYGIIVVEAATRSGTLITARCALEQGREVFAVPGSPLDPRCQGANKLIRGGATLIQDADDVLDVLAMQQRGIGEGNEDLFDWGAKADKEPDAVELLSLRRQIKETLSYTPLHRDELLREFDAAPGLVADALLDLVLAGEVHEHSGCLFSLSPPE